MSGQKQAKTLADGALEGEILEGRYEILTKLGKGGMAWVYKAIHMPSKQVVAVKILFSQIADDTEFKARFLREARIQHRLEHPNIVHVKDFIEYRGLTGFVLEYCNGGSLLDLLKHLQAYFNRRQLCEIFLPLVDAMAHAHERGVVHRDLKPHNVLFHHIGEQVFPKITDFGIAKQIGEATITNTGTMIGTLHYMSPEQVQESKQVDHRADIYSLGVLLYQLASGSLPFLGKAPSLMLQILNQPPPTLPHLDRALHDVIFRCLEKDPDARFENCRELKDAFCEALAPESYDLLSGALAPVMVTHDDLPAFSSESDEPITWQPSANLALALFAKEEELLRQKAPQKTNRLTPSHTLRLLAEDEAISRQDGSEEPFQFPDFGDSSFRRQREEEELETVDRSWIWKGGSVLLVGILLVMYTLYSQNPTVVSPPTNTSIHQRNAPDAASAIAPDTTKKSGLSKTPPVVPRHTTPPNRTSPTSPRTSPLTRPNAGPKTVPSHPPTTRPVSPNRTPPHAAKQPSHKSPKTPSTPKSPPARPLPNKALLSPAAQAAKDAALRQELAQACAKKDIDACEELAKNWLRPPISPKAVQNAHNAYAQACRFKNGKACVTLAQWHEKGINVPKDQGRAEIFYADACKFGERDICFRMGQQWRELHRYKKARRFYRQACKHNHPESCEWLGWFFQTGLGGKQDYQKAAQCYQKSCDLFRGAGCNALGVLNSKGLLGPRNDRAALLLYQKACDYRDPSGCYNQALYIWKGWGGGQNLPRARTLFAKACQGEDALSCHILGILALQNTPKSEPDKALVHFTKACDLKLRWGCFHAGFLWARGHLGESSCEKARPFLKKACTYGLKPCRDCTSRRFPKRLPALPDLHVRRRPY